jgi:hypothetical protein
MAEIVRLNTADDEIDREPERLGVGIENRREAHLQYANHNDRGPWWIWPRGDKHGGQHQREEYFGGDEVQSVGSQPIVLLLAALETQPTDLTRLAQREPRAGEPTAPTVRAAQAQRMQQSSPCAAVARLPCDAGAVGSHDRSLESEAAQARMVVRSTAKRPAERPLVLEDRHVVDARMAHGHQPLSIELPILVAK